MKYAVIRTGGKQYKVAEGDVIEVEHVSTDAEKAIVFEDVLFLANDGSYKVGTPFVSGLTVTGMVVEHMRGPKIRVGKFKAKARYRRITGHRQSLSKIRIDSIGKEPKKAESKTEAEKPAVKTVRAPRAKKTASA